MASRYKLAAYLTGATAARMGDEASGPALLLLGIGAAGAVAGSALLAGLTVAAAVGGPWLGAALDRSRTPGRVLAGALAGYAIGLAALTTLVTTVPLALAVAVATGLLGPAIAGGWTAQVPSLTTRLERASALDAMTFTVAALAGPGLAGALATVAGAETAMLVSAALVLAAVPFAWRLPAQERTERPRMRDAVAVLVRNPALRRSTATSTLSFAGIGMAFVCYPLLGEQRLGGAGYGTLLLVASAIAALAANAVLARKTRGTQKTWNPDRIIRLSTVVLAIGFAGAAVAPNAVLLVLAVAVAGIGDGPQLAALFAVRHREAPPAVRTQVFTTAASVKIAGMAAGTALAGPLAAHSPAAGLAAAAGFQLLAAVAHPWWTGRKPVRTPSPARAA